MCVCAVCVCGRARARACVCHFVCVMCVCHVPCHVPCVCACANIRLVTSSGVSRRPVSGKIIAKAFRKRLESVSSTLCVRHSRQETTFTGTILNSIFNTVVKPPGLSLNHTAVPPLIPDHARNNDGSTSVYFGSWSFYRNNSTRVSNHHRGSLNHTAVPPLSIGPMKYQ